MRLRRLKSSWYSANRPRTASLGAKVAQMVDRLFAGSPEEMVTALMEYRGLSADEADRIREMIDAAETKSSKKACALAGCNEEHTPRLVASDEISGPPIYSRTLLTLAQLVQHPKTIPGSVGFLASRWKLEQRVAGLLDESRDTQTILSRRAWAFVLASTVGLLTAISVGTVTMATAQTPSQISTDEKETRRLKSSSRNVARSPLALFKKIR